MSRVAILTKPGKQITIDYRLWVMPEGKEYLRRKYGVDDSWTETIEERPWLREGAGKT